MSHIYFSCTPPCNATLPIPIIICFLCIFFYSPLNLFLSFLLYALHFHPTCYASFHFYSFCLPYHSPPPPASSNHLNKRLIEQLLDDDIQKKIKQNKNNSNGHRSRILLPPFSSSPPSATPPPSLFPPSLPHIPSSLPIPQTPAISPFLSSCPLNRVTLEDA